MTMNSVFCDGLGSCITKDKCCPAGICNFPDITDFVQKVKATPDYCHDPSATFKI